MSPGLRQRIITAILIGIPILFLVFFNDYTKIIFLLIVALFSSFEYLIAFYKNVDSKPKIILSILLSTTIMALGYFIQESFIVLLPLALISSSLLIWDLYFKSGLIHHTWPWLWSVLYIGLPLGLMIAFIQYHSPSYLLIVVLLMIWISDIGAYFVGKSIGKRKLMPRISPGKTWEGFLGAGVICVLSSYIFFSYYQSFNVQFWAITGSICWLAGSIGDLVESKIKRTAGIKDSGQLLPGHGGFLDRFDGFIFCLPFAIGLVFYFGQYFK